MELCSPRMGPLFAAALPPQPSPLRLCLRPQIPTFSPQNGAPPSRVFVCFPMRAFFVPPKKSFCAPEWHFRCPVMCSRAPFPPYGPNPKADFPFFALFWPFLPQTSELNRRAAPKTLTLGLKRPQNDLLDAIQPQRAFLTLSCPLSPKIALFWPIFRAGRG